MLLQLVKYVSVCKCAWVCMRALLWSMQKHISLRGILFSVLRNNNKGDLDFENHHQQQKNVITDIIFA